MREKIPVVTVCNHAFTRTLELFSQWSWVIRKAALAVGINLPVDQRSRSARGGTMSVLEHAQGICTPTLSE